MAGHRRYAWDVESDFKQARDAIMAQVMKMKVVDFQEFSCTRKSRSDRVSAIWKYLAQIEEGWIGLAHVGSDAAHLLAAGAWLGGLAPLGFILLDYSVSDGEPIDDVDRILLRFSSMGYVAVATLVASGLINSRFLVGSVSSLLTTLYGQIPFAKLGLFAAMLALAAANRFWLVPRMIETRAGAPGDPSVWLGRLRYHVLGEQFLGLMVLLAVSVLGTMRPAVG
jgi:putative copper resistance protein D